MKHLSIILHTKCKRWENCFIILLVIASKSLAQSGYFIEPTPPPYQPKPTVTRQSGATTTVLSNPGEWTDWQPSAGTPTWIHAQASSMVLVDLIFLVDGSGSVNFGQSTNFDMIKGWIRQVAAGFDVTEGNIRIGVVQYSHWYRHIPLSQQRFIKTEVPLGGCQSRSCLDNNVDRIKLMGYTTYTGAAIHKTVKLDFASSKPKTNKIMVLLTDGASRDDVTDAAAYARAKNVTIFCVGVGKYRLSELQMIANGERNNNWRVYQLANFSQLPSTVDDLQREIKAVYEIPVCSSLIKPRHGSLTCTNSNNIGSTCTFTCYDNSHFTIQGSASRNCQMLLDVGPTWSGNPTTCGACSGIFDLLLIIDSSSSIGDFNFGIIKDFIIGLVDTFEIGQKDVQISAIRYNRRVDDMWDYNTHQNRTSLLNAILNIRYGGQGTLTGRALSYALKHKFSPDSGRRGNHPHLTIVFTDGETSDPIDEQIERLHEMSRVIAIGVGNADQSQIDKIASNPNTLYSHTVIGNFVELLSLLSHIAKKICKAQQSVINTSCILKELPNPSNCHPLSCSNTNKAGSVCIATCCTGFEIRNKATARCNYDGHWSQTAWQCIAKPCPELPPSLGLIKNCSNGNEVGSICVLSCKDGYAIVEDSSQTICESRYLDGYHGCANRCLQSQMSELNPTVRSSWEHRPIVCIELDECLANPCHNGSCLDEVNGFTCVCNAGYTGTLCELDINDCEPNPCQDGTTCVDGINSFVCECTSGFFGALCEYDVDSCSPNKCKNNGTCIDKHNGYACECAGGYSGQNCEQKIEWCDSRPCQNGNCSNSLNGFVCECASGFTGHTCDVNVDDCLSVVCLHGGSCYDVVDGFICLCSDGYTGERCQTYLYQCDSEPCLNNGTCLQTEPNEYSCYCAEGYEGDNCEVDVDECESNPCANRGICVNKVADFQCLCIRGFEGKQCRIDKNECASHPCQNGGICQNHPGRFRCSCPPGYAGVTCGLPTTQCSSSSCGNGTCINQVSGHTCNCNPGYTGQNCNIDINECSTSPCRNNGTCMDLIGTFYCNCSPGYTGKTCNVDINACLIRGHICNGNGRCEDHADGAQCECFDGFEGAFCGFETNECNSSPCVNGYCTDIFRKYECTCWPGFDGYNCENNINDCTENICQNEGRCFDLIANFRCECMDGFVGNHCEINYDECSPNPCLHGGRCEDGVNTFRCICLPHMTGPRCQIRFDECSNTPCQNGAWCETLEEGGYICTCLQGYSGHNCEHYFGSCETSPCQNNGWCRDTVNGRRCHCLSGFTGNSCEVNINDCSPNPCQHGGRCIDGEGGYECLCEESYKGDNCEIYLTLNPCPIRPCQNNGICIIQNGNSMCSCAPGFEGEYCEQNVNECNPNPCHHGGTCVEGRIRLRCLCEPGYTGKRCEFTINNCLTGSDIKCLNGGTCIHNPNGYTCNCSFGYTGNACENEIVCPPDELSFGPYPTSICTEGGGPGKVCRLHCPNGMKPISMDGTGQDVRTCLKNGTWSIEDDKWGCKIIRCENFVRRTLANTEDSSHSDNSSLQSLQFVSTQESLSGRYNFHRIHCSRNNFVGSTCRFECVVGYEMHGSTSSVCRKNGTWSNRPGNCVRSQCPSLSFSSNCSNGNKIDSTCVAVCPDGFEARGPRSKICTELLRWEPIAPWFCVAPKCSDPLPTISNGIYICTSSNNLKSVCTTRCLRGYKENTRGKYTCSYSPNGNSFWKGIPGGCENIPCDKSIDLETGHTSGLTITDNHVTLAIPPYLSTSTLLGQCQYRAVIAISGTSPVSLDLWYGHSPTQYHLDIGNSSTANGLRDVFIPSAINHEMTGFNSELMAYRGINPLYWNGTLVRKNGMISSFRIFEPYSHISLRIINSRVTFRDNRGMYGAVELSPNLSSENDRAVHVGFNRLANLSRLLRNIRVGSDLCYVCIN